VPVTFRIRRCIRNKASLRDTAAAWIRLLLILFRMLYPAIFAFCCIGVFSVSNAALDVMLAGLFGVAGVILRILDCSPAPLILTVVLEPLLEENFRRAMILSSGDGSVFFLRRISLGILLLTLVLALYFSKRKRTVTEQLAQPLVEGAVKLG